MDYLDFNREAWDHNVRTGNRWTLPVDRDTVARARRGDWSIVLTPTRPVPRDWFPSDLACDLLALAGGGGQQGPVLAAAGARVTIVDNSPAQLAQDRAVAAREDLDLVTLQGDMADLAALDDAGFDVVIHPVANCFVPEVRPVWRECYRVLRPGGCLLAGFCNPAPYVFDWERAENDRVLEVTHRLPHADVAELDEAGLDRYRREGWPLEWSHSLDDQLGGQLAAGFIMTSFFEDNYAADADDLIAAHMPMFMATRALKPETA